MKSSSDDAPTGPTHQLGGRDRATHHTPKQGNPSRRNMPATKSTGFRALVVRNTCECHDAAVTSRPAASSPIPLDDVSKAIIEQLQQDGRRSYAAIGKVVGL